MNILSLVNSAESLDKAIALTFLMYQKESAFYRNFDRTTVFYGKNLPKISAIFNAHGTCGGSLDLLHRKLGLPYKNIDDLWEDRRIITQMLIDRGRITPRMAEKLNRHEQRFRNTIRNVSWDTLFPEYGSCLVHSFTTRYPGVEFMELDLRKDMKNLGASISDYQSAKLYMLNPDGIVSSKRLDRTFLSRSNNGLSKSIEASGNIYLFLSQISLFAENREDICIGYREMKKFPRLSYDRGLASLLTHNNKSILEPSNKAFGEILSALDSRMLQEVKTNIAVCRALEMVL
ncbi:MAG: hypothetical protein H6862_07320 [Rhodospirillales bacterium]|nr:hypothetical protein [Rhodospirillales bacterium]